MKTYRVKGPKQLSYLYTKCECGRSGRIQESVMEFMAAEAHQIQSSVVRRGIENSRKAGLNPYPRKDV